MKEEKSMVEYKESKGILGWLKSKFEKLKERFSSTKNVQEHVKQDQEEGELTEEQLDQVRAGIDPMLLNFEEEKAKLDNLKPKSWELTEDEKQIANNPIEHEKDELTEEELEKITAGHPILEEDEYSK